MPNHKPEILLIGGGGHCKSVIDVIEQENRFVIAGIVDKKELIGTRVLDYEVIACDDYLETLSQKYKYAIVTVGQIESNVLRIKLYKLLKTIGYELPVVVSPLAYVSKHSFIDEGSIIMHDALVNAGVKIGKNCIINTKALIEHDCIVQNNCHISTSAVLNGGVVLQEGTFFGSNATSKEYVQIKQFVKAGSVAK